MAINKLGGQVAGVNPLITAVASMAPKNNYRTFPQLVQSTILCFRQLTKRTYE